MRWALFDEIIRMSWDTLRGNKLRSALTILGIVIGITSIVGITSLLRGFDESFKDSIKTIGPDTIFVSKWSIVSFTSGMSRQELFKRPNITTQDAQAIERNAPSIEVVDVILGQGAQGERIYYKNQKTKTLNIFGTTEKYPAVTRVPVQFGRFFTEAEVVRHRQVIVLGQTPYLLLFPNADPIGKTVRLGLKEYEVIGVMG